MAATNHTEPDRLSQFTDDDKPSWRGDYNSDMQTIQDRLNAIYGRLEELQRQINGKVSK